MSFIGIVTNQKNEEYIRRVLKEKFNILQIIFINNKNIKDIKNIRFETIVIDSLIEDIEKLKLIVLNAKYIILNSDWVLNFDILDNVESVVLSYGFNSKSTFTVSSISDGNIIICMQRIIEGALGKKYEPQEFEVKNVEKADIYVVIFVYIIMIIYQKIPIFEN